MVKFNSDDSRRVTQQEIARLAGVSHVAVSRTLHRSQQASVSLEKQEEIRRIANELGYRPRALTTHTIGLALPVSDLGLEITSHTIRFANTVLRSRGYRLALAAYDKDPEDLQGYILDQKSADGVLLLDTLAPGSNVIAPELPRVLMADADERLMTPDTDQVAVDVRGTMERIVAYLVGQGHKNMGLVVSPVRDTFDNHLREQFQRFLEKFGLSFKNSFIIEALSDGKTAEPLLACLAQKNPPTAIITGSAARALVVLNALQWAGYRVPEEISVISFTDSERLALLRPAISATTAAGFDVVSMAIERLLQKIENPDLPPQRTLIPGTLVPRESVLPLAPRRTTVLPERKAHLKGEIL